MEVNISLEDLFGDSIREMRERDKAFLPEPEWFSRIETDLDTFMQTYMTKYPFTSFEAIPGDESGLTFLLVPVTARNRNPSDSQSAPVSAHINCK